MTMVLAEEGQEVQPSTSMADSLPGMTQSQFDRWVELLERRTGMVLPRERRSFLVTSLALRMRQIGYRDVDAYYEFVTSGLAGNIEWTALVDRLTVHETRFFRDPRALRLLRETVLPAVVARPGWDGQLNIWSVGCSTGEEAYTLAMVADRYFNDTGFVARFGVTGTDISLQSLSTAKAGTYSRRRATDIPEEYALRYCEPADPEHFLVSRKLRRRVCFAQINVLDVGGLAGRAADVVYCQNLLIYFDRTRRQAIVDSLVKHLRPGGVMILGAGEVLRWTHPHMTRLANQDDVLAFRRSDEPAERAVAP